MNKTRHTKVSTTELILILIASKAKTIEASLNNSAVNATHFLRFGGRKIFDCGIDSRSVSRDVEKFLSFYSQAYWRVDQIV